MLGKFVRTRKNNMVTDVQRWVCGTVSASELVDYLEHLFADPNILDLCGSLANKKSWKMERVLLWEV